MATVSRQLPTRPHLDVPKREARELLAQWREGRPEALERIRHRHPKFNQVPEESIAIPTFKLHEAQRVIASEYGFASWAALKKRISADTTIGELQDAIERGDRDTVVRILRANPELLHVPVWSSAGDRLKRTFVFHDFADAMRFVNKMAAVAEAEQHHPDFAVHYREVAVTIWTHAVGGLSENDFILAAKIDAL